MKTPNMGLVSIGSVARIRLIAVCNQTRSLASFPFSNTMLTKRGLCQHSGALPVQHSGSWGHCEIKLRHKTAATRLERAHNVTVFNKDGEDVVVVGTVCMHLSSQFQNNLSCLDFTQGTEMVTAIKTATGGH